MLLTAAGCRNRPLTIQLSREELQRRLDTSFPVDKQLPFTRIVLEHPRVVLTNGSDRIGVGLDVRADIPFVGSRSGSLTASGELDYRREQKAFFLRNAKLDQLAIQGLGPDQVGLLKSPLETLLAGALTAFPLYEFKSRNVGEVTAEHVLQRVYVKNGAVYAELAVGATR